MIGDSTLSIYTRDISKKGRHFQGTRGLWELFLRKNVNKAVVTRRSEDMTILQVTNVHLQG